MKTRLRPPCFIEVPLSIKEIEWVCIYVCWGIDFVYVIPWPKGKGKKYLQNTTHKTKDRAPKILLKTGIKPMDSGWVSSSCSTRDTHCYKPSDEETTSVITTNGTYPWSFVFDSKLTIVSRFCLPMALCTI
jgi:hypothetical protein